MEYTTDDKTTEDTFHLLSTQLLKVSGEIVIIAFKKVDYGIGSRNILFIHYHILNR